jgi:hypothetical protein
MQFPFLVFNNAWSIDRNNRGALVWVDEARYVNEFSQIPLLISTLVCGLDQNKMFN